MQHRDQLLGTDRGEAQQPQRLDAGHPLRQAEFTIAAQCFEPSQHRGVVHVWRGFVRRPLGQLLQIVRQMLKSLHQRAQKTLQATIVGGIRPNLFPSRRRCHQIAPPTRGYGALYQQLRIAGKPVQRRADQRISLVEATKPDQHSGATGVAHRHIRSQLPQPRVARRRFLVAPHFLQHHRPFAQNDGVVGEALHALAAHCLGHAHALACPQRPGTQLVAERFVGRSGAQLRAQHLQRRPVGAFERIHRHAAQRLGIDHGRHVDRGDGRWTRGGMTGLSQGNKLRIGRKSRQAFGDQRLELALSVHLAQCHRRKEVPVGAVGLDMLDVTGLQQQFRPILAAPRLTRRAPRRNRRIAGGSAGRAGGICHAAS